MESMVLKLGVECSSFTICICRNKGNELHVQCIYNVKDRLHNEKVKY